MNAGLILDLILGGALYLAYGKKGKWPAILTAATGVGLWGAYHHILKGAASGFKKNDSSNNSNSRKGVGGGPGLNEPPTPRHPWADEPGSPWHGGGGQPTDVSNPANKIDPSFIIGHNAIQRANQPVWEHSYGQSV